MIQIVYFLFNRGQWLICICLVFCFWNKFVFAISNRYIHLDCYFTFFEYSSIYWWNPCKSLDFFSVFSDFTSVYCEICEILNIWYPLLNLCVQVSTGCRLQERRGRDHCIDLCVLFSETINYLLIAFPFYIQFISLIWVSDFTFKS